MYNLEKLYYIDQYIKEFTAEIEEIIEKDNKFHVVLDKTAFFPGGGGQPCDLGFIEEHEVLENLALKKRISVLETAKMIINDYRNDAFQKITLDVINDD